MRFDFRFTKYEKKKFTDKNDLRNKSVTVEVIITFIILWKLKKYIQTMKSNFIACNDIELKLHFHVSEVLGTGSHWQNEK